MQLTTSNQSENHDNQPVTIEIIVQFSILKSWAFSVTDVKDYWCNNSQVFQYRDENSGTAIAMAEPEVIDKYDMLMVPVLLPIGQHAATASRSQYEAFVWMSYAISRCY